jgi:cell division protein ZapA
MSQISIRVNGRDYPIVCDDGREERVRGIGSYVDEKVREIVGQVGQAGDARLMLLAAARAVLLSRRGSLAEQLERLDGATPAREPSPAPTVSPPAPPTKSLRSHPP